MQVDKQAGDAGTAENERPSAVARQYVTEADLSEELLAREFSHSLSELAASGVLPPWVAKYRPPHEFVYSEELEPAHVEWYIKSETIWVPSLRPSEAIATMEWLDTLPQADVLAWRIILFDWLRNNDFEEADASALAWWCNHHPDSCGVPPSPQLTAIRFACVSAWYAMLSISSLSHNHPHMGLGCRVIAVGETFAPDDDSASLDSNEMGSIGDSDTQDDA